MSTPARKRATARKIVGSLGVIGTAVAGLGTFGIFTDSTSVDTTVQTGTLSIDLGAPGGVRNTIPVSTAGFLPRDSLTRAINLENDGMVGLSSVHLATTANESNALTTDRVNGLRFRLEQCSRAWTKGGTTELPTYSCGGSRRTLDAGPAVSTDALPTPNSLKTGGTDNMVLTLTLPAGAGSDKQGFTATVNLGSSAVQAAGTAR